MSVSSARHLVPAAPRHLARSRAVTSGAERASPSRTRLVAEGEASHHEQLRQVAQAALLAQPPQGDMYDQVGRFVPVLEGRTGALAEETATGWAANGAMTARRPPVPRHSRGRGTMGTGH